jgi:hypothetical protein
MKEKLIDQDPNRTEEESAAFSHMQLHQSQVDAPEHKD